MNSFFKMTLQKLGGLLVELGSKLIQISYTRKHLHAQINTEINKIYRQSKGHRGEYLERAFAIVDDKIKAIPVDSDFFDDYYILKSEVERHNNYFLPTLLTLICTTYLWNCSNL